MNTIETIIKCFKGTTIGVVGDVLVDRYIFGSAERISPEAPAPIVAVHEERQLPGGAANAAANIAMLGGTSVLIGVVGDDESGLWMRRELKERKIRGAGILTDASRRTTQKIRVMAMNQQMLRVDREDRHYLSEALEKKCIKRMKSEIKNWDAILISDYTKGAVTPGIAKAAIILSKTHKKPIIVNTKPNHFAFFAGATLLSPNKKEAEEVLARSLRTDADIRVAGRTLQKRFRSSVLLTRGADGMTLFEHGRMTHFPAMAHEVYDVTGASDTVVAACALAIGAGATLSQAAEIANHAAGIVVGKVGTAAPSIEELQKSFHENKA